MNSPPLPGSPPSAAAAVRLAVRPRGFRPVAILLVVLLGLGHGLAGAEPAARLPDLGSSTDTLLTPAAEARIGQLFMRQVRQLIPLIEDPHLTQYLDTLGRGLVRADGHGGDFQFFLVEQSAINAFAGPGGYIGVFSGLILAAQTESELAAVLAHEVAHVSQRHVLRAVEDQRRMSLPATALLIAAAVLGAQVSPDAGIAAMAGVQAAAVQRRINFTRDNEREADRIGIATLARAGFDPYAMAGFFGRLSRATRTAESQAPEFLRTHPVNAERIAEALNRAEEFGARQRPDSFAFQLARAQLRERAYERAERAIEHFEDTLRRGRFQNELAERYGHALALERARRWEPARREAERLLRAHPAQSAFIALDARLDLAQGQSARAREHLRQALSLSPGDWPLRMLHAEVLLADGQARQALNELVALTRERPPSPTLYQRVIDAAHQSGDLAAWHRYRAEKLYVEGELETAIRQLEIALRERSLGHQEAAQLQARLEDLRRERREDEQRSRRPLG